MANASWTRQTWQRFVNLFGDRKEQSITNFIPIVLSTYVYSKQEDEELELDLYEPAAPSPPEGRTLILYFHGGGFAEGSPKEPRYTQFMEKLAQHGFETAAVSYRLTMRGQSMGCDQQKQVKIAAFRSAVEDVWAATRFVLSHAAAWGVNPQRIALAGSSAGAEAVVNAAYWPSGGLGFEKRELPDDFQYAGLLAMAGALLDLDWITETNAVPTCLFHGIDDPLVPFASASHHYCTPNQPGFLLLHGGDSIAQRLRELNKPYLLIAGTEGGHGWADKPMADHLDVVLRFLKDQIQDRQFLQQVEKWKWV
jgi:acetyl esterase/lipase